MDVFLGKWHCALWGPCGAVALLASRSPMGHQSLQPWFIFVVYRVLQ